MRVVSVPAWNLFRHSSRCILSFSASSRRVAIQPWSLSSVLSDLKWRKPVGYCFLQLEREILKCVGFRTIQECLSSRRSLYLRRRIREHQPQIPERSGATQSIGQLGWLESNQWGSWKCGTWSTSGKQNVNVVCHFVGGMRRRPRKKFSYHFLCEMINHCLRFVMVQSCQFLFQLFLFPDVIL